MLRPVERPFRVDSGLSETCKLGWSEILATSPPKTSSFFFLGEVQYRVYPTLHP